MSAICGVIQLDNSLVDQDTQMRMIKSINTFQFDSIHKLSENNVFLCCGIQYVTKQSRFEQGLHHEQGSSIYYVADCFLDNREELLQLLGIEESDLADSELLFLAYQKWNDSLGEYVCGIYSFVIYDAQTQIVRLYTDHSASRCLYVRKKGQTVFFSTVIGPILAAEENGKIPIDETFITGCLATMSPDMYIVPGLTAFEGVYQILAGHYAKISKESYEQITYWTPFTGRKDYQKLGWQEAKGKFLSLFTKCVNCLLQADGKTGMTLSSGLDSSSIACLAAKKLQEEQQKLYSFTSVPVKDYKNEEDSYFIVDESFGPKEIQKKYSNLVPAFLECKDKNAFTNLEQNVHDMECPYKSVQNMVWLTEVYQKAEEQGIKLILKGQYGNATISYGNILSLINEKCHRFQFISSYREFLSFMKVNHVGKKAALRGYIHAVGKKIHNSDNPVEGGIAKKQLLHNNRIEKQIKYITKVSGGSIMDSAKQRRNFLYYLQGLQQLGAFDTRFGLLHNLVIRDPSKDKRMLEFCACIPMECFVHKGVERAMIRDYMKGIIPERLISDLTHRGLQSADFTQRIEKNWSTIYDKVLPMFENKELQYYCDTSKLDKLKSSIVRESIPESSDVLTQVMHLYSMYTFFNQYE